MAPPHRTESVSPRPPARLARHWHRILTYMQEVEVPISTKEIEKALEIPRVKDCLKRMADAGVIERVALGVYVVAKEE